MIRKVKKGRRKKEEKKIKEKEKEKSKEERKFFRMKNLPFSSFLKYERKQSTLLRRTRKG